MTHGCLPNQEHLGLFKDEFQVCVEHHHMLISFPTAFWFQQQNPGPNIIVLFPSHFILQPSNSQPPSLSLHEKIVWHLSLFDT